jgi:calcineurin-like phosphoesterase family protein
LNYFISDLHFGCTNNFENRTLEYDKLLIENWNRIVTNKDDIYILGDIGRIGNSKDNEYLCQCLSVLKGHKHLVLGNHDGDLKDIRLKQLFVEICDYKKITDNFDGKAYKLILSHYPMLFWDSQHKGSILIYGHLHMSDEYTVYKKCLNEANEYFKDKTLKGYTDCPEAIAYNVGCMLPYMDYTPRTLKEIIENSKE